MRLVYESFKDGGMRLFETENDGSNLRTIVENNPNSRRQISVLVTVNFDDTAVGRKRLLKSLDALQEHLVSI